MDVLTKENFFRPNENVHIQLSDEYPNYIGIWHTHNYIEVVYIISGSAFHEIDGNRYKVKRGDLFIINMNTPHVFFRDENAKEAFSCYDLMFTPEFFDKSLEGYNSLESLNNAYVFYSLFSEHREAVPFYNVSDNDFPLFGDLFDKIYLEHKIQKNGYTDMIRAYLLQLIITIFRMDSKGKDGAKSKNINAVNYVVDYIKANYANQISVSKLAKEVFLHPDYLGRIFRDTTGLSVGEMIQKVRIENACCFLSDSNLTVADVACKCGFFDLRFFYTVFKKRIGISPGEYRKRVITK
ncbi:MAG: helix-turn-helix domain-containing protein [Ruminococcaceae bacterium]|nr:helix-turn-helix domain-containing protein [Oscillospiraceae bacterium]